jgi:hypothetical protein
MVNTITQTAAGLTNILNSSIVFSHGSTTATATIDCVSTTLDIGDQLSTVINGTTVFGGYIKQISQDVNKGTYTITASDILTRATDYFIVPTSPTDSFTRSNISGEQLISDLLALASITSTDLGTTSFTFATTSPLEIKLVSVYDFCKEICDLLSWHIWADKNGVVHFKNRKPYVMVAGAESSQPGFVVDSIVGATITDNEIISASYIESNADIRNKIVVQGSGDIYATASAVSPYLPNISGNPFYASVFFSDYQLITTQEDAQKAADYNLLLLNRLHKTLNLDIIGDVTRNCWTALHVTSSKLDIDSDFYVYGLTHSVSNGGFITSLELRS